MILDPEVLQRTARNCVGITPVRARHKGRTMDVRVNATEDITQLIDSATRDNMAIIVVAVKGDFADKPPKSLDSFYLFVNENWKRFQIRNVPDFYDPISPTYTINLVTPEKGIE